MLQRTLQTLLWRWKAVAGVAVFTNQASIGSNKVVSHIYNQNDDKNA